jgi:hypothetical protein
MNTAAINSYSAEILRGLGAISDNEASLARVAKYVRRVVKEQEKDSTLMTEEEFFARVEKAEKQIADGKGITFANLDDMNQWLNSL